MAIYESVRDLVRFLVTKFGKVGQNKKTKPKRVVRYIVFLFRVLCLVASVELRRV